MPNTHLDLEESRLWVRFSLFLSLFPLSSNTHTHTHTGAILSILLVWLLTGGLLWEAYNRLMNPEPVNGLIMLIVSTAGLFVNVIMAMILYHSGDAHLHSHAGDDGHHDHNAKDGDLVLRAVRVFLFSLSLSLSLSFKLNNNNNNRH